MMRFPLALAASLLLAAHALGQEPSFSGGDGSSCEQAVVPANEGIALVQAEHHWLRKTYGGGVLVGQALGASSDGRRRYDLVVWRKPNGETVDVCFDVTTVFEETIRQVEEEESGAARRPAR